MSDNSITYELCGMEEWDRVGADLAIADPPFGIDFDGKNETYNRDESNVVDGYVEWEVEQYRQKIRKMLDVLKSNIASDGQALVFSGWNNSHYIHQECMESDLQLEGKLYWNYNFAPYCSRRPAHNVYEIYWLVNKERWYYDNECSYDHCQDGEANLSAMKIPRDYHKDMPKYPTRTPIELLGVLYEHFSQEGDTIFNPLAGSGVSGCVAKEKNRSAVMGDLNENGRAVYQKIRKEFGFD